MSWISDLAGKAEDFLVKIDKSAADRLIKERSGTPGHSRQHSTASVNSVASVSSVASKSSDSSAQPSNVRTLSNIPKSTTPTPGSLKLSRSKVDMDAVLMESLNNESETFKLDPKMSQPLLPIKSNGLSLEQENALLNQEIKALNQELRQTTINIRQAEKDAKIAQQQFKTQTATVKSLEEMLSTLRKENMALADDILEKGVELNNLKSKIKSADIEQDHLVKLETLQAQLDFEVKHRESLDKERNNLLAQIESEKTSWQTESYQLKQQIDNLKEELSETCQSFNEYKLRAQRILQSKDTLLQDLKQQKKEDGIQPSELLVAELEQLQQERDLLREETAQSNAQLQQCRREINAVQNRCEEEVRALRNTNSSLETRLTEEKTRREFAENETRTLTEELRFLREDAAQQKIQSAGRIRQLEGEVAKIRQQLTSKQNSISPSQIDLEQRLRTLTETLVAKQAALEAVQSERSSLVLQLERANKLLDSERSSPQSETSTRVMLNITDDELAKVSSGVSRRMRNAYSSLDSLNFRLGQALRRRPAARLVLFFYMVLLHFWVVFVLLTYSPEMHEN